MNDRLKHLENEYLNFPKKYSEDKEDVEMDDVTFVNDDQDRIQNLADSVVLTKRKLEHENSSEGKKAKLDKNDMHTKTSNINDSDDTNLKKVNNEKTNKNNDMDLFLIKESIEGLRTELEFCKYLHSSVLDVKNTVKDKTCEEIIKLIENVKHDFNDDFEKHTGKIEYKDKKHNMKQLLTKLNKLGYDFKTKRFQRNADRKFMIENVQTFMKDKNEQLSLKIKCAIKRQTKISK